DHVRRDVRHLLQAVLTVHRRRHLEPLELKVHGDELADHLVVVDDQNASQWLGHGSKLADSHPTRTANAHVRVTPPTLVTFYRAARGAQGPLSSGDRATASGAVCAGSNPAGGADESPAETSADLLGQSQDTPRCVCGNVLSDATNGGHLGTERVTDNPTTGDEASPLQPSSAETASPEGAPAAGPTHRTSQPPEAADPPEDARGCVQLTV